MSEIEYRDVIARMAIDPEFAATVRADLDGMARRHHLSEEQVAGLRVLAEAVHTHTPSRVGGRLSRSPFPLTAEPVTEEIVLRGTARRPVRVPAGGAGAKAERGGAPTAPAPAGKGLGRTRGRHDVAGMESGGG